MQDSRSLGAAAKHVREAQYRTDAARHQLREAIREARSQGMTLRDIADITGLSFGRIHQLEQS